MIRFAKMAYPGYDIYKSSGYPKDRPFGSQDAAHQIVMDMIKNGYYVDFVETLIKVEDKGYMGRSYTLKGLHDVIEDVLETGFNYDNATGQFFENQSKKITRNWGRLIEGDERQMAVLRMDIAGNSILVKENPKQLIDKTYNDLRKIITKAVESRFGRLWIWEGDGALAAFMLGKYSRMAIFSGIEILNEMFFYNKMNNRLNSAVALRVSVNSGDIVYSQDDKKCMKSDTVQKAIYLEAKAAAPDSLVIPDSLAVTQDQDLLNIFCGTKFVFNTLNKYRIYQISQEKK
jgi:class 3 adenylate cyclase